MEDAPAADTAAQTDAAASTDAAAATDAAAPADAAAGAPAAGETSAATDLSQGGAKPSTDPVSSGVLEIAKQLVDMAPELATIKQCMNDVKAGLYKPSDGAKVASGAGATIPPKVDATGQTPQLIIESKKLVDGTTVVNDANTAPKTEEDKANDAESAANPVKVEKDDKKGDTAAAPADGAKKDDKKAEGGAAQTGAEATTEGETAAAADAAAAPAAGDAPADAPAASLAQTSIWHMHDDYFHLE